MEKISPVYHQSAVQLREPARRLGNVTKSVRAQVDHESHGRICSNHVAQTYGIFYHKRACGKSEEYKITINCKSF